MVERDGHAKALKPSTSQPHFKPLDTLVSPAIRDTLSSCMFDYTKYSEPYLLKTKILKKLFNPGPGAKNIVGLQENIC